MVDADYKGVRRAPDGRVLVQVPDTLKALGVLARFHREKFSIPVIAVTGSNGKTTTKELIAQILSTRFRVLKSKDSYNNDIGVPLTLFNLTKQHEVVVLEMAMRGPGELKRLCEIAAPDAGVVTCVGPAHIGRLGSLKEIAYAKRELVENLPRNGICFLNCDDPLVFNMRRYSRAPVVFFGKSPEAHVRVLKGERIHSGWRFVVRLRLGKPSVFSAYLPLLGDGNLLNAAAATAVCKKVGMKDMQIKKAMSRCRGPEGRLQLKRGKKAFWILDDTYNANPDSLKVAIRTLASYFDEKRKFLVLGDMLELGRESTEFHREAGKTIACGHFSGLFTVGQASSFISQEARKHNPQLFAVHFKTAPPAIRLLKKTLKQGDVVLVKGSRSMRMEQVVSALS